MNQLLTFLLSLIVLYGYPIVFLVILFGELGLPLPMSSVLLAAGSFTADGTLNLAVLIPLAAITAIIGDCIGYFFGKRFGRYLMVNYFPRFGLTQRKIDTIEHFLESWGIWFIFFSRWLFTPLGVPLNLIAGIGNYPFKSFLLSVICGEIIWASMYSYLGHLFGSNWVSLLKYVSNAPWILALLIVAVSTLAIVVKMRKKTR